MNRLVTSGEIGESDQGSQSTATNALSLNIEAQNAIVIPIRGVSAPQPPTEAEDDQPPETKDNEVISSLAGNALSLNIEEGNAIAISMPAVGATTTEAENEQPPETQYNENQTSEGSRNGSPLSVVQSSIMYKAAREGDWAAAEKLLMNRDPTLAWGEITEIGDRALHVAVSGKHTEFVRKIIKWMSPSELELYDGHGYTACCYAAMAGLLDIVFIITKTNPDLVNVRNWYGTTPFTLAVSYGNASIVSYFMGFTQVGASLSESEWFDLMLVAVHNRMFDVALNILKRRPSLATLTGGDERTALHVLAQLDISSGLKTGGDGKTQEVLLRLLAEKLWENIQDLGKQKVLKLMKNPPILHHAAKVGNVDLIEMITYDYPDLLSHIDPEQGHSIFHIVVMHRQESMLYLIKKARNVKDFNAISQDKNGNNLLHSAGKSLPPKGLEIVAERDVQMQRAYAWFKSVKAIVPPFYLEMRNKDGCTPIELFWKEHATLLANSEAYMKRTSESCMLISTIILTLVFAAAFTPPGGFNQETGIPILLKNKWFACFIIFEALALFSSTYSIIEFWSIISSNYDEGQFLNLPHHLRYAMCALLLSVLCAISAFLSAFLLVYIRERPALVISFMLSVYLLLVVGISCQLFKVLRKTNRLDNLSNYSLWRRLCNFGASIFSFCCSCF